MDPSTELDSFYETPIVILKEGKSMKNPSTLRPSSPARYGAIMAAAKIAKLGKDDVDGYHLDEESADDQGMEEGYSIVMSERATEAFQLASASRGTKRLDSKDFTDHLAEAWSKLN